MIFKLEEMSKKEDSVFVFEEVINKTLKYIIIFLGYLTLYIQSFITNHVCMLL